MAGPRRYILVLAAIGFGFGLSGCTSGNLELDPAYWFPDGKKKLPGDRREVFPGGVPGVTQGIPPEMIRGNPANQPEQALAPEQAAPQPEAEQKPRPRPKKVARPRPAPVDDQEPQAQPAPRATQAAPRPAQQQQQPAGAWPAPQAQQQQQPQQQAPAAGAWPAPPASGTFTR